MLKKLFLDIFFPQFCLGCGREGGLVCQDCLSTIEVSNYQFCPFCKKPKRVIDKGKCPSHRKMSLDGLFAADSYKNSLVKSLIKNFKYAPYLKTLKKPLAYLIVSHFLLSENKLIFQEPQKSFLLPVPLSAFKERERGFNQTAEIAKVLSDFFKIPLCINGLIKIKKTQPQVTLKAKEREKNIRGAFKLKNPHIVRGKKIFLIDDVFTTGSTMEECAKVLKKAGAKQVWGVVVARETLGDTDS